MSAHPYVGQVTLLAGPYAPAGWLPCDGALYPIASYETLFYVIGTTYGGDGEFTFAVPDLRGRVPLHAGAGPGLTPRVAGEGGGEEVAALEVAHLPPHSHPAGARATAGTSPSPPALLPAANAAGALHYGPGPDVTLAPAAVGPAGGGQPHPNTMPTLAMTYGIAYAGTFPSPQ